MTQTEMTRKTIEAMEDEVEAYCREKGWYDSDVPFQAALALLHEEAAEAGSVWRKHGLADVTGHHDLAVLGGTKDVSLAKPEGVGSELADIIIRLLDDSRRYGLGLPSRVERYPGVFGLSGDFLTEVNTVHDLVSLASMAWQSGEDGPVTGYTTQLVRVFCFVQQMAGYYQVNLLDEYTRKMDYNRARPYRHGDLRA